MTRAALALFLCAVNLVAAPARPALADAATTRAAVADGVNRRKVRAPSKRKAATIRRGRGSAQSSDFGEPLPTSPVSLLDGAGIKQLLARGTPPNERPLLVNFWATWCEPCRLEFPDLVKIDADYSARGLQFVTISIDDPAELKTGVPKFLRAMRARMPAYLLNVSDSDPVINAVDPEWSGELPATFLFDRHGQIVFKHKGRIKPMDLRAALDKVLNDQ